MEFTLYYRGKLNSNGDLIHKHNLRRHFHPQIKKLWEEEPLKIRKDWLLNPSPPNGESSFIRKSEDPKYKSFNFATMVNEASQLIAELDIMLLRPEPQGAIITNGGDIDNRIKTLFDALQAPLGEGKLPKGVVPGDDEDPFHCLLEDDKLITKVTVNTARLLEPVKGPTEVVLLINVKIKQLTAPWRGSFG